MARFLRVQCDCGGDPEVVYGDAKQERHCRKCGKELVIPTGGRAHINGRIIEVLS